VAAPVRSAAPVRRHQSLMSARRPRRSRRDLRCENFLYCYQDLVVTAPAALREQLADLYMDRLIYACEQLPEPEKLTTPNDAVTVAIKSLAVRCRERMRRHQPPATTSLAAWPRAKPKTRSCAASSATSPARSTTRSTNPREEQPNSLPEGSICYGGRKRHVDLGAV
jgi:hypothetical protein